MNREELFASIVAARPGRDDSVYLERRGESYRWHIASAPAEVSAPSASGPDAWLVLSADWPGDPAQLQVFFDDLLAELESMADRTDRCRWPLSQPWPHSH